MYILAYQTPEKATGRVAEIYNFFVNKRSPVPAPLQLLSASPGLLQLQFDQIGYFAGHQALSFSLLAAIRFLAAQEACYDQCTNLNRIWLSKTGLSAQDLTDLAEGRNVEAFSEAENGLLAAVAKMLRKEKITETEMQQLRNLGWKDSDILDACAQGANLMALSYLYTAFSQDAAPEAS
jgi:alkylhydroperoxidase family enzyme